MRRPVATWSIYLAVSWVALSSLSGVPLSLAPPTEEPMLSVTAFWRDASPRLVEARVTRMIEGELQRLPRVTEVRSVSSRGTAQIDASFEVGAPMERIRVLLQDRLSVLRSALPQDVSPPQIQTYVPEEFDEGMFFVLRASGPQAPAALSSALEKKLLPRLLSIPGVAGGTVYGGPREQIRIDLNPDNVAQGRIDPGRAGQAVAEVGGLETLGTERQGSHRMPIVWERPEATAAAVAARPSSRGRYRPVTLGEVADVREGWETPRSIARVDGEPAVQVVLEREPGSNVIEVADALHAALERADEFLPPWVELEVLHDQSETIREELGALTNRAGFAAIAIFVVLLLSGRGLRASVVVLSTLVFVSLSSLLLFRLFNLGFNLVTLAGVALAFGMAVDNSIVVQENAADRARGRGHPLRILAATREVLFPLLAATATTAVVLLPFLYLSGDLRRYYLPFVLSVGLSLTASLVVALTLTPLLSLWALRGPSRGRDREASPERFSPPKPIAPSEEGSTVRQWATKSVSSIGSIRRVPTKLVEKAGRFHAATLSWGLRHPWPVVTMATLVFAGSVWVFHEHVDRGAFFPPGGDTGLQVGLALPRGAQADRTDSILQEFEKIVLEHPLRAQGFVTQVETSIRENRGGIRVRLHPVVVGSAIPQVLKDELSQRAAMLSGVDVSVSGFGPGFNSGSSNVSPSYQLRLKGPDFVRLEELAEDLGRRLERHPRVRDVDTHAVGWMVEGEVALHFVPEMEELERSRVSPRRLVESLSPALAGELSEFTLRRADGEIPARVRWNDGSAPDPAEIGRSFLVTEDGRRIPMQKLFRTEDRPVQTEIRRRDQQYERGVAFDFRGPRRVGSRFVTSLVEGTELPPGYTLEEGMGVYLGRDQEREILWAVLFALTLVYLVAAALFESLLLPFVALLSVPLSFVGIPLLFWATGDPFDRTAYIGLVLLVGIAINTALLFVHRAGKLHSRGVGAAQAAARAARERARPILLTTATSVAGLLPLALFGDPGAGDSWRALALSASAGLLASSFVTLWILPPLFVLTARIGDALTRQARRVWRRASPLSVAGDATQTTTSFST